MPPLKLLNEIESVITGPDVCFPERYLKRLLAQAQSALLKQPLPDKLAITVECRDCQYLLHASAVERTTEDNVLNVKIRIDPHDCGRGPDH